MAPADDPGRCDGYGATSTQEWAAASDRGWALMAPPVDLTPRQRQVARLLDQGLTQAKVAERLGIKVRTVEDHAAKIRGKMGAPTTREAVPRTRRRR